MKGRTYCGLMVIGWAKDIDDFGWFIELKLNIHNLPTTEIMSFISKLPLKYRDSHRDYSLVSFKLHTYRRELTLRHYEV